MAVTKHNDVGGLDDRLDVPLQLLAVDIRAVGAAEIREGERVVREADQRVLMGSSERASVSGGGSSQGETSFHTYPP